MGNCRPCRAEGRHLRAKFRRRAGFGKGLLYRRQPNSSDITRVRTNLTAVFFTIQAALPHLKDGASIILSGSVQAVLGIPRRSAYAATKGGVRAMGRNLASELAPRRIRVNQVTPGATRTPLWSPFAPTEDAMSALEQQTAGALPLGRMGDAEEVAKAALYLASDDASYMIGAEIVLDGGATSAPLGAPIYRAAGW